MKTAHLGRRLGDWLGIVPEDEIPWSAPDLSDLDALGVPAAYPAPGTFAPAPVAAPPEPGPVLAGTTDRQASNVRTFRDVVNQRRAETQRRAVYPQTPTRW